MELVRAPALRPKRRKRYHETSDSDGFRMCLGHNMRKRTGADADGGGANAANLCRSIILPALLCCTCAMLLASVDPNETTVPARPWLLIFIDILSSERAREGGSEGGAISHFQWRVK